MAFLAVLGLCFNSLQTGKSFRTIDSTRGYGNALSFQFPSNGKVLSDKPEAATPTSEEKFQFPSNGKVLLDQGLLRMLFSDNAGELVSIPFKRESPFGPAPIPRGGQTQESSFNSLQTGKSFWTPMISPKMSACHCVSIPFKRESPFGQRYSRSSEQYSFAFQFPSNGKVLLDSVEKIEKMIQRKCFNSLQTGKSFWTAKQLGIRFAERESVSIPFKRESPFGRKTVWCSSIYGKPMFQFPSNGKVLLDTWTDPGLAEYVGFNSLQTGKSFWTYVGATILSWLVFCFNSLQTGKSFWTTQ